MYVILSHPAYNRPVFKVYSNIPQEFRTVNYLPKIYNFKKTFKLICDVPSPQRWVGTAEEALQEIPNCLELKAQPLIVDEKALWDLNPQPTTSIALPINMLRSMLDDILKILEPQPSYHSLCMKIIGYLNTRKGGLELNEEELGQIHALLKIQAIREEKTKPIFKPEPDLPPHGAQLIDMSVYEFPLDENGDPILPPEYANIEPAFGTPIDLPTIQPPDSIAFGQSKGEALRLNKTRRRKV